MMVPRMTTWRKKRGGGANGGDTPHDPSDPFDIMPTFNEFDLPDLDNIVPVQKTPERKSPDTSMSVRNNGKLKGTSSS